MTIGQVNQPPSFVYISAGQLQHMIRQLLVIRLRISFIHRHKYQ